MKEQEKNSTKKCPFKVGDKVKFTPSERTIGWYQHSFKRLRIYLGYEGIITKIIDDTYLYLDGDIGGFAWTEFIKVKSK